LTADDGRQRLYAPWRDDPRPLSGLLQGVYAFLGVTDFWRRRRVAASAGSHRRLAEFEFARWREHTWQALGTLRADTGLTDLGRRFARGMAARMRPWWAEVVDPEIAAMAQLAVRDHRTGWRIRHLRPDPDYTATLAQALSEGGNAQLGQVPEPLVVHDASSTWSQQRVALARIRAQEPGTSLAVISANRSDHVWNAAMLPADLALVAGDNECAAGMYASLIAETPCHPAAWAGLILALAAHDQEGPSLMRCPELVVRSTGSWPRVRRRRTRGCWLGSFGARELHRHGRRVDVGAGTLACGNSGRMASAEYAAHAGDGFGPQGVALGPPARCPVV
jgi:hypothetical protein